MSQNEDVISKERPTTDRLPARPQRRLAVVTCMDARVDPWRILGAAPGDIHVIRNAGGIVTDDVLRSLLLSQRKLGTNQVKVVMHTDCGLSGLDDDAELAAIEDETGQRPPFGLGGFVDPEDQLRASVQVVRSVPYLPHTDRVSGSLFDVVTGDLRTVVA